VSIQAIAWVEKHSQARRLGIGTLAVLKAIASFADQHGENAWPSVPKIAETAGCVERTVYRAIPVLIKAGDLEVVRRSSGRGWKTVYGFPRMRKVEQGKLDFSAGDSSRETEVRRQESVEVAKNTHSPVENGCGKSVEKVRKGDNLSVERVTESHEKGDILSAYIRKNRPLTVLVSVHHHHRSSVSGLSNRRRVENRSRAGMFHEHPRGP
jgi:hypothetical protein